MINASVAGATILFIGKHVLQGDEITLDKKEIRLDPFRIIEFNEFSRVERITFAERKYLRISLNFIDTILLRATPRNKGGASLAGERH